jgi:hypothetical protein
VASSALTWGANNEEPININKEEIRRRERNLADLSFFTIFQYANKGPGLSSVCLILLREIPEKKAD